MATQIFIEPELENLHENSEEWLKVCAELGLHEQLRRAGTIEKVGNPYMKVDPRSERVYTMLCPAKEVYTKYSNSTIPLDILQEINRCVKNGWFNKIEVWYDDKSPDPFVVGHIYRNGSEWNSDKFLIARWGDELLPFEQLLAKAVSRFRDAYKAALQHLIATCEVRLKDVDTDINGYIDMGSDGWGNGAFKFPTFENPIR